MVLLQNEWKGPDVGERPGYESRMVAGRRFRGGCSVLQDFSSLDLLCEALADTGDKVLGLRPSRSCPQGVARVAKIGGLSAGGCEVARYVL